jgi:hypothetical protein
MNQGTLGGHPNVRMDGTTHARRYFAQFGSVAFEIAGFDGDRSLPRWTTSCGT